MFPELKKNPAHVTELVKEEEISFGKTLDRGITLFEEAAVVAESEARVDTPGTDGGWESKTRQRPAIIPAEVAFRLHDTYGFPIDLTRIMAEERGMKVDLAGYERLMEEAKDRARAGGKEGDSAVFDLPPNIIDELSKLAVHATDDSAKFKRGPARATVRAIWNGRNLEQSIDAASARAGEHLALILDKTSFYAEMGGQVGDSGEIKTDANGPGSATFIVETTRAVGGYVLHIGHLKSGKISVTDSATATVLGGRDRTEKNHTATHIANWALRETLGDHVQQKGSLVDPEKLRFDFVHPKALADDELAKVETLVSSCIEKFLPVFAEIHPQDQAMKIAGLRAVFGEKYPPMVRVVAIGESPAVMLKDPANPKWRQYSVEFCGGTHLGNSQEAESFVITAEESVSKGIRRIVALTGAAAKEAGTQTQVIDSLIAQSRDTAETNLPQIVAALQKAASAGNVPLRAKRRAQHAVADIQDRIKKWQKSQSEKSAGSSDTFDADALLKSAESVAGVTLIVATLPADTSADTLRNTWDWLKKKHPQQNVAAVLASVVTETDKDGNKQPPKVSLLAGVGDPFVNKLKAGDWIKAIVPTLGGTGGGRPQMAMGGGKDTAKLPEALAAATEFARSKLA
jgi:alanyl-tRNA synthetase